MFDRSTAGPLEIWDRFLTRRPNRLATIETDGDPVATPSFASPGLAELKKALSGPDDLRQTLLARFPDGIKLIPDEVGPRQVWTIEARPDLGQLLGGSSKNGSDPGDPSLNVNPFICALSTVCTVELQLNRPRTP